MHRAGECGHGDDVAANAIAPAPPQLDSGVLRGDSRSTGRSSSKRRVWLPAHRYCTLQDHKAPGHCPAELSPRSRGEGSRGMAAAGDRCRLRKSSRYVGAYSLRFPSCGCRPGGTEACTYARTCARTPARDLLACVDTAGQCSHCPHGECITPRRVHLSTHLAILLGVRRWSKNDLPGQ